MGEERKLERSWTWSFVIISMPLPGKEIMWHPGILNTGKFLEEKWDTGKIYLLKIGCHRGVLPSIKSFPVSTSPVRNFPVTSSWEILVIISDTEKFWLGYHEETCLWSNVLSDHNWIESHCIPYSPLMTLFWSVKNHKTLHSSIDPKNFVELMQSKNTISQPNSFIE